MTPRQRALIAMRHLAPDVIPRPTIHTTGEQTTRLITAALLFVTAALLILLLTPLPTGRVTTTAYIFPAEPQNCSVALYPGENYVSFNCISTNEQRSALLNKTNVSIILAAYQFNKEEQDQWKVYAPWLPSWVVQDLTTFSRTKGYIILINTSSNGTVVNYTGALATQSRINVYNGFNLVGYPSIVDRPFPFVLTTINDTFSLVRLHNRTNGILEYAQGVGGTLDAMRPYDAYWIRMSTNDEWIVRRTS